MMSSTAMLTARVKNHILTGCGPIPRHRPLGIALAMLALLALQTPQARPGFNAPP
jgi:hypothetical protein